MESDKNVRYAGFWLRFLAHCIDGSAISFVAVVSSFVLLGAAYWTRAFFNLDYGNVLLPLSAGFDPLALQALIWVVYVLVAFPYYVWSHYRWGATLGKTALQLRVVDADGESPLTWSQSVVRTAAYVISWFFMIGFVIAAVHPRKRALHDLIAGTLVVVRKQTFVPGIPE